MLDSLRGGGEGWGGEEALSVGLRLGGDGGVDLRNGM